MMKTDYPSKTLGLSPSRLFERAAGIGKGFCLGTYWCRNIVRVISSINYFFITLYVLIREG